MLSATSMPLAHSQLVPELCISVCLQDFAIRMFHTDTAYHMGPTTCKHAHNLHVLANTSCLHLSASKALQVPNKDAKASAHFHHTTSMSQFYNPLKQ